MLESDDLVGLSGTVFLIVAYIATTQKLIKNLAIIDILNMYGSFAVGYNCAYKETYPPLILECVWFCVAVASLYKNCTENLKLTQTPKPTRQANSDMILLSSGHQNNYQTL